MANPKKLAPPTKKAHVTYCYNGFSKICGKSTIPPRFVRLKSYKAELVTYPVVLPE